MGLFSFFKTNPEDQIRKATGLLDAGEYARARNLVEGMEEPTAKAIYEKALHGLADMNLREAEALANALEFERAEEHLELAINFGIEDEADIREVRRLIREKRTANPPKKRKAAASGGDPFGMGGGGAGIAPPAESDDDIGEAHTPRANGLPEDSIWNLPPDDPRLAVAMAMESYPEELRERLLDLGADFLSAVALIDAGEPKKAIEALSSWVEKEPAVRHERARAALNDGNIAKAASDLAMFGEETGHQQIGQQHTAALLAQLLAQQGRVSEGITHLEKALKKEKKHPQLRGTLAHLLEVDGQIDRADETARSLVRDHPKDMGLYKLMARCRIRAGKRMEAMQVLESGLKSNCTTGTCGAQPFDVESGRILTQLYLEDRLDPKRAEQLLSQVKNHREEHHWIDEYLDVLVLRNRGDETVTQATAALLSGIESDDPRHMLAQRHLELPSAGESQLEA